MNQFERATRMKLRWPSQRGPLSVEDLWELPLTSTRANQPNLDDLARAAHRALRDAEGEVSFVRQANASTDEPRLQLEIIKSIITTRQEEAKLASDRAATSARRQELLGALEERQREAIKALSEDEIRQKLAELG